MKSERVLRCAYIGAFCAIVVGCSSQSFMSTTDGRIHEKAEIYNELTAEEQKTIRAGYIEIGFSADMVYMALGKPERIDPGKGPGEEVWVYHNFYSADGRSINMPMVVKRNSSGGGGTEGGDSKMKGESLATGRLMGAYSYTVEYDAQADQRKAESTIKVHVKFAEGEVSDIQVINDGH